MLVPVSEAYVRLIEFDLYLRRGDFSALYKHVRGCHLRSDRTGQESVERICAAVNMASVWYWKEVLCLQRSAATTCLLRRYGIDAKMVIGAQPMPFQAHAWVEVDGRVVNDKPYMPEKYAVLGRC